MGRLPLKYRFDPGHARDGVTLTVPLALLNQLEEARIDWLVPGMVREKVNWAIKALPSSATINIAFFMELISRYTTPVNCGAHERFGSANPYDVTSGVWWRRSMQQRRKRPGRRGRNSRRDRFDMGSPHHAI